MPWVGGIAGSYVEVRRVWWSQSKIDGPETPSVNVKSRNEDTGVPRADFEELWDTPLSLISVTSRCLLEKVVEERQASFIRPGSHDDHGLAQASQANLLFSCTPNIIKVSDSTCAVAANMGSSQNETFYLRY
jgi:hypothetical protein